MTISRLLQHNPSRPHPLTTREFGPWRLPRVDLIAYMQPEKMSQLVTNLDGLISEDENILFRELLDFVNFERCPISDVAKHITRIFPCLLRSLVSGVGEFSMLWCNPSSLLPLRLQAFAGILFVLHCLRKFLSDQPSFRREFGQTTSDIICLLFDEESIFMGSDAHNHEDVSELVKQIKAFHYCSSDRLRQPQFIADTSVHDEISKNEYICPPSRMIGKRNIHNEKRSIDQKLTIDSKFEFQAALKANLPEDDEIILTKSDNSYQSAQSVGGPASNRRRWMAVSTSVLSTIEEDGDRTETDDERAGIGSKNIVFRIESEEPAASDSALFSSDKYSSPMNIDFGVKQMRIPSITSSPENNRDRSSMDLLAKKIPLHENDIEAAGDSFLDSLG